MADMTIAEIAAADACCAPERLTTCCEPSAKAACCGKGGKCGCDTAVSAGHETDMPERV